MTRRRDPIYTLALLTLAVGALSGFVPGWRTPPPSALDLAERAMIATVATAALVQRWRAS